MKLFFALHPLLQLILTDASFYCYSNDMDFTLTATKTTVKEDISEGRESSTHRDGRAADGSVKKWNETQRKNFRDFIEITYGHYGALMKDGSRKILIFHDAGSGDHWHLQLDRTFTYSAERS